MPLLFVTGGARSGKSAFAQALAEGQPKPWTYIATAEALDSEMEERIARHRQARDGWLTVEEPVELVSALGRLDSGVALIDCLTLWVSNLMGRGFTDGEIIKMGEGLATASRRTGVRVIAVTNEVGSSIVPENALARRFRDLSGLVNQEMARASDEAYLLVSGMPLRLK